MVRYLLCVIFLGRSLKARPQHRRRLIDATEFGERLGFKPHKGRLIWMSQSRGAGGVQASRRLPCSRSSEMSCKSAFGSSVPITRRRRSTVASA